ncbi:MAG: glycosyltransferase family 4 protein [Prevotellaceae bacterium]|jgi:glycosyltransferase involved in cell wall biosynthesis|nr:glycosyltransferase family 4 protein [Prevotellaceae bacterium]
MRIGFDAKRAFKNFTGLGNYSRAVITALAEVYPENDYFLYTPPYKNHPLLTFSGKKNITVRTPSGIAGLFPAWWRTYGMKTDVRADGIQLFHGLSAELPVGLSSKTRTVVTIHDLIFLRYPEYYKPIDRWIYTKKYASACARADLIIAISEQTRQDLITFFHTDEKKIRLVYQGCDPQFYNDCDDSEKALVKSLYRLPGAYALYVGTIEKRKNLLTLVKAMRRLPSSLHLVVVGKAAPYFREVRQYVADHAMERRVLFLHDAPFRHFPAIYRQAQVFCYPSTFEGFGIPLLEALNAAVPVVAARTSSLPEAGGAHSLYVDPFDDEAMAEAISKAIDDKPLRRQMIDEGLRYALQFRDRQVAENIGNVYKELL